GVGVVAAHIELRSEALRDDSQRCGSIGGAWGSHCVVRSAGKRDQPQLDEHGLTCDQSQEVNHSPVRCQVSRNHYMPSMFIPPIFNEGCWATATPYRPMRMCIIPNPTFAPTDTLQ